ncbi:MAG: hypothetical protein ABFS17_10710 [Chloroflexota bacterium]
MSKAAIGWDQVDPVPNNHQFSDFLQMRGGKLFLDGLDLDAVLTDGAAGDRLSSPLEIVYLPIIREKISQLENAFQQAIDQTGYPGKFIYTYASKANAAEEVIRTILESGVNYELSSWIDVAIVKLMQANKILSDDKLIICNGFKPPGTPYAEKIIELQKLRKNVIPVIEDQVEISSFAQSGVNFDVGLRLKSYGTHQDLQAMDRANSRFGMDFQLVKEAAAQIEQAPNLNLKLFHAMVGSQINDEDGFVSRLTPAIERYAQLRQAHHSLEIFDFGGGVPVQQTLNFAFDYQLMAELLLTKIMEICSQYDLPVPDVMGEMGRYTVAEHGAHIFKVVTAKDNRSKLPWYIIDGSIMSSFPDVWALGEKFVVLPLNHLDEAFQSVQLGGITCDSDDVYPPESSQLPLFLPENTENLYIGFFNIGSYQEMLGGVGGSKHCVIPEANELVVDKDQHGNFVFTKIRGQSAENVLQNLGYQQKEIKET